MYSATKVMTRNKNILMLIVFVCALFLLPFFVGAQNLPSREELLQKLIDSGSTTEAEVQDFNNSLPAPIYQTTTESDDELGGPNCFDYYRFQGVTVNLGTGNRDTFYTGEAIQFNGEITNKNYYPVIDGNLFVRIAKKNSNYFTEGHFIIDEFFAGESIILDSNKDTPFEYKWISKNIPEGEYIATYFFSAGKKFNLGGLSFTNEVIAGSTEFTITSKKKDALSFDRSGTKVNGEKYKHIGNWPLVDVGKPVVVTQPLINSLSDTKDVTVTYNLYYWDGLLPTNLINSKTERVTIGSGDTEILSYTLPSVERNVYYLQIIAESGPEKSIVNIRFVTNESSLRLNYPAITAFPIVDGEPFTLFSCFHNTSDSSTEGVVNITLVDKSGKTIGDASVSGPITGDMGVIIDEIVPTKNFTYLKIIANVANASGIIADTYEIIYDCEEINTEKCKELLAESDGININILTIMYIAVGFLVLIIAGFVLVNKKKKNNNV